MLPDSVLQIVLPLPLPRWFDYLPPPGHSPGTDDIGKRARVPFGSRELTGVVVGIGAATGDGPAPAPGLEETQPAITTLGGAATTSPRLAAGHRVPVAIAGLGALALAIVTLVAWRGARWLAHQVTRREYRGFLESLPVADALRFQPVTGWSDRDPAQPVAWITFERAAAFCRALQAELPTSDAWLAASEGAWGLDPQGTGHPGPLQEWTATARDGLVVVRGGHERMSPAGRAAAASEPLMKSSEAQAGPSAAPNIVASETIGFRCVRAAAP